MLPSTTQRGECGSKRRNHDYRPIGKRIEHEQEAQGFERAAAFENCLRVMSMNFLPQADWPDARLTA